MVYSTETIKDLIEKDTDGDGVPDWEERLYGLDPTKKETTPGIPDSVAIAKLKANREGNTGTNAQAPENLTETDKFSRELFSTVATLNQNGVMDQTTVDKISSSLADHIKNSAPRKVYALSDIKVTNDSSSKAIKNYFSALNAIQKKYPDKGNVADILQRFIIDENNVDASVLIELDPIINQMQKGMSEALKMNVPQSISSLHLDLLNAGERVIENLNDIKLFDTDPIVTLSAVSQYDQNIALLGSAANKLAAEIRLKLNK